VDTAMCPTLCPVDHLLVLVRASAHHPSGHHSSRCAASSEHGTIEGLSNSPFHGALYMLPDRPNPPRDQGDCAEQAPWSSEGPSPAREEAPVDARPQPSDVTCSGYWPPLPVCEICERIILDPHDPMEFGVCQACWRVSYKPGGVHGDINQRPEGPGDGEGA
jgi:hypothetical protein